MAARGEEKEGKREGDVVRERGNKQRRRENCWSGESEEGKKYVQLQQKTRQKSRL